MEDNKVKGEIKFKTDEEKEIYKLEINGNAFSILYMISDLIEEITNETSITKNMIIEVMNRGKNNENF